jgi:hypothetical protein
LDNLTILSSLNKAELQEVNAEIYPHKITIQDYLLNSLSKREVSVIFLLQQALLFEGLTTDTLSITHSKLLDSTPLHAEDVDENHSSEEYLKSRAGTVHNVTRNAVYNNVCTDCTDGAALQKKDKNQNTYYLESAAEAIQYKKVEAKPK